MNQERRRIPRVIKVDAVSSTDAVVPPKGKKDLLNPAQRKFFEEFMAMDDAEITDEFFAEAEKDPDKAEVLDLMASMI